MSKKLLIESTPTTLVIVEGKKSPRGNVLVRGEFGRYDTPTKNGRSYPKKLMQREVSRLQEAIKNRSISMCGTCDHPADGKTSIKEISHIITDLSVGEDGIIYGEAEILGGFPGGKMLMSLIESNIKIPVSSRGYGSTAPGKANSQVEEVQDDFVLRTYDFVSDPAMETAIPEVYTEDVDDPTLAGMFLDAFPEIARDISSKVLTEETANIASKSVEDIKKELSESFEKQLRDSLVGVREEISQVLREEYESDPDIGGAKGVLAAISEMVNAYKQEISEEANLDAEKAADLEIAEMKSEIDSLKTEAKLANQKLYIERKISGHVMAESIRTLVGDRLFDSQENLDNALTAIMGDLDEDKFVTKAEAELMAENARLNGDITLLESKVEDLTGKVDRAVKLGERVERQRIESLNEAQKRIDELEDQLAEMNENSTSNTDIEKLEESLRVEFEKKEELLKYKLDKVAAFTNGRELLELMESVNDRPTVDKLVSKRGTKLVRDPMLRSMVDALAKGKSSEGDGLIFEDTGKKSSNSGTDEFGNEFGYMAQLAGIPEDQQ